jgi:hypothetical protein
MDCKLEEQVSRRIKEGIPQQKLWKLTLPLVGCDAAIVGEYSLMDTALL